MKAQQTRSVTIPTEDDVRAMTMEERRAALVRLVTVQQEIAAGLTMVTALLAVPSEEPLWDAKRTGAVLTMSPEWVREHGTALGIEADLGDGTHRYVPERVRALRESRKQAQVARMARG